MNIYPVLFALLFLCFLTVLGENPTHSTSEVSVNCGSSGTSAALDGREWLGDVKPKFSSLLQIKGSSSTASTVTRKFISADPVLHRTARISRSKFSYEFQVSPVDIKLDKFDWDTIAAATNNFSHSNQVGKGRFGPVYKAVLPKGQAVAVKSLSPSYTKGLKELKNEILLLQNLQHQNIIKLLGYCIHRKQKFLLYEFMENRSLMEALLDKEQRSKQFHWAVRFKIIMGIARGLVYLHQDSGLRVIYGDLKSSNILLDSEMNPKISDFALARTLEYQSDSDTTRICGTLGSMTPEYYMHGKFSIESYVYNFGIVTLEIISGRRAVIYQSGLMFLHEWAWKLWNEGKALDLVDESLGVDHPVEEALRCIQIGLLCIQWHSDQRPTLPSVIKMLEGNELLVDTQEPWLRARPEYSRFSNIYSDGLDSHATIELDDTLER